MRVTYDDKAKSLLTAGLLFMPFAEAFMDDGSLSVTYTIPKKIPEKADLKVEGISSGTASVGISFAGYTRKI